MRRLQMERFRRLLVNFDDDISGSPGNDDDDGEVEVCYYWYKWQSTNRLVTCSFRRSRARTWQSHETAAMRSLRR
jgi:hypothetical protein